MFHLEFVEELLEGGVTTAPVARENRGGFRERTEQRAETATVAAVVSSPPVAVDEKPMVQEDATVTAQPSTPVSVLSAGGAGKDAVSPEKDGGGTSVAHASPIPSVVETSFGADGAPAFLHRELPVYPLLARRLGREGKVTLKLYIDAQGRLRDIGVIETTWSVFTEAAKEALRKSTFKPARINGRPTDSRAILTIRFQLD